MLVRLLGLILVTAFAIGFSSYVILYDSLIDVQKRNLLYAARSESEHLKEFIEIKESKLKSIAMSREVLSYSESFNGNILFGFYDKYKDEFPVLSFVLHNGREELRIEDGVNSSHLINIDKLTLYKKIIENPNKVFTQVDVSADVMPEIVMAYHRENFFGQFEGVVTGRIPLSVFFKPFNEIKIGKTGYVMLLDSKGVVLIHPQKNAVMKKVYYSGVNAEKVITAAINMQTGFGRASILGVDSFFAYAPVENRNWSLVTILPYSEFEMAPDELRRVFLEVLIVIVIVGVLVSLYMASEITRPVYKLIDSSDKLAKGDLAQRVEVAKADELGRLGLSFNLMARSLEKSKSELADIAKNREELIDELETKNAELERFTYTVSHDLKSPLVTIKGFIGLLKQDLKADDMERVTKDLEQIAFASDNMSDLLGDILELSRVGRVMNKFEMIPLNEIFNIAVTLLHGPIEQSGAVINVQENMPDVYADSKRITEVAQNLLENAMKFKCKDKSAVINVSAYVDHDMVICCVEDNGVGIAAEYHDLIFGLFERLDQSVEGTGIGLALIKRIIDVHKGELTVESEGVNKGAKFCFSLPCRVT